MALLTAIKQFMGGPKKVPVVEPVVVQEPITVLTIDYPSEGLNNIAKKINELIERENAKIS